jgi:hypothetical protein
MKKRIHRRRDADPAEGVKKFIGRIREEAKRRRVALPDPEEFLELMARVRSRKNSD